MESLAEHSRKLAVGGSGAAGPRSVRSIRFGIAVKATLVLAVIALAHEQPSVVLLALAPLALVAAEAVRHLGGLDEPEEG
jgi:hypothetical protein